MSTQLCSLTDFLTRDIAQRERNFFSRVIHASVEWENDFSASPQMILEWIFRPKKYHANDIVRKASKNQPSLWIEWAKKQKLSLNDK